MNNKQIITFTNKSVEKMINITIVKYLNTILTEHHIKKSYPPCGRVTLKLTRPKPKLIAAGDR